MVSTRNVGIRFYVGAKRLKRGAPWPGEVMPVDRIVDGLKQLRSGRGGDEEWEYNGRVIVGRVRAVTDDYAHLVFYRIRHDNLPSMWRGSTGDIEDLDIDDEDSLAEPTEMLFFNNGVIAHAFNKNGPGSIHSAMYIEEKTKVDLVMASLLRADALKQLRDGDEAQLIAIRVAAADWEELSPGGRSLRDAARSAAEAPGTGSIELLYRAAKGRKDEFLGGWLPRIQRLVAGASPGSIQKLKVRKIDVEDRSVEMVDLLNAKICTIHDVQIRQPSRHLLPDAAEKAMVLAYNKERSAILEAVDAVRGLTFEDDAIDEA